MPISNKLNPKPAPSSSSGTRLLAARAMAANIANSNSSFVRTSPNYRGDSPMAPSAQDTKNQQMQSDSRKKEIAASSERYVNAKNANENVGPVGVPITKPASISNNTSSGGGSSYSPPSRPTPSATPPSSTSTPSSDKPAAPTPPPTDSGGVGGNVRTSENSGGVGRNARRGQNVTNKKNPRVSRSLTIDELKKQAARNLGI